MIDEELQEMARYARILSDADGRIEALDPEDSQRLSLLILKWQRENGMRVG